jgi:predicted signal transduction protein with EAL and GGDEF domain
VSKRLTSHVRETDMVARLGGDEFTIVLPNIANISEIEQTVTRVLNGIATPFDLEGHELFISASIGITIYPNDATDISTMMTNADNAMYRAKDEGRNTFCFFTPEMNKHAKEMLKIENDLHHAIQKKELVPYFQPIIDINTGELSGTEVLLRWKHPEHGIIMPESFIPITEAAGLIVTIGKWLLEVVCCQIMRWRNSGIDIPRVYVNISGRQFRDNLIYIIQHALDTSGLEPEYLGLEILESVLLEENKRNADVLQRLSEMGVHLSIDDFGTGYSSLSYLKRYPFDVLKINRRFIYGLPNDKDDSTLVNTIISMAQELGLEVVAEGVESKQQLEYLRTQGCDKAQGFYFAKPMSAKKFENWIQKNQAKHLEATS